ARRRTARTRCTGCRRRRTESSRSHALEAVPELVLLGLEVAQRRLRRGNLERQPLGDRQAVALEADQLARVVGQQPHRADVQVLQDLDADAVVALIRLEAEALVRFDGIEPLLLQLVGADLVGQADAAPFL